MKKGFPAVELYFSMNEWCALMDTVVAMGEVIRSEQDALLRIADRETVKRISDFVNKFKSELMS